MVFWAAKTLPCRRTYLTRGFSPSLFLYTHKIPQYCWVVELPHIISEYAYNVNQVGVSLINLVALELFSITGFSIAAKSSYLFEYHSYFQ
jgi:hypothetical protein